MIQVVVVRFYPLHHPLTPMLRSHGPRHYALVFLLQTVILRHCNCLLAIEIVLLHCFSVRICCFRQWVRKSLFLWLVARVGGESMSSLVIWFVFYIWLCFSNVSITVLSINALFSSKGLLYFQMFCGEFCTWIKFLLAVDSLTICMLWMITYFAIQFRPCLISAKSSPFLFVSVYGIDFKLMGSKESNIACCRLLHEFDGTWRFSCWRLIHSPSIFGMFLMLGIVLGFLF
jgi:hypothetical protein